MVKKTQIEFIEVEFVKPDTGWAKIINIKKMHSFRDEKEMFVELDNFIYKSKSIQTELRNELINSINKFLSEKKLNKDTHNFVDLKENE